MDLSKLTSEELVVILNKNGFNITSINSAQRKIYEKRLYKKLSTSEGNQIEEVVSEPIQVKEEIISQPILVNEVSKEPKNNEKQNNGPFFAVQIPNIQLSEASLIFTDFKKAKIFCKDYPNARFKVFKNLNEAENFTKEICPEIIKLEPALSLEGSLFPSIKYEEIFKMKRKIAEGCVEEVQNFFFLNPRYLISSGDTPIIYQEGNRYNALHLASYNNQPAMCSLILNTLSDNWFLESMYPNVPSWMIDERRKIILDLYLNMPDKELNETPLHFASKFGFIDVLKVLISTPYIDRTLKNKYSQTALDIACSRVNKNTSEKLRKEILNLFEEQFYTIVLRSDEEAATLSAVISPEELSNHLSPHVEFFKPDQNCINVTPKKNIFTDGNNATLRNYESPLKNILSTPIRSTPNSKLNESQRTLSNTKNVAGIAGPLSFQKMEEFRKLIVTCGKTPEEKIKFSSAKKSDSRKGLERVCRELARREKINWIEYWDFLDSQVDISSVKGLSLFENHLQLNKEKNSLSILTDKFNIFENSFLNSSMDEFNLTPRDTNALVNNIFKHQHFEDTNITKNIEIDELVYNAKSNEHITIGSSNGIKKIIAKCASNPNSSINSNRKIENQTSKKNLTSISGMKSSEEKEYLFNENKTFNQNSIKNINSIEANNELLKINNEYCELGIKNLSNEYIKDIYATSEFSKFNLESTNKNESNNLESLNISGSSVGELCNLLKNLSLYTNMTTGNIKVHSEDLNEDMLLNYDNKKIQNDICIEESDDDFISTVDTIEIYDNDYNEDDDDKYFDSSDILFHESDTFINGEKEPSILDVEVYYAIEFLNENDLILFPNVLNWFNRMKTFEIQNIKRRPNKKIDIF